MGIATFCRTHWPFQCLPEVYPVISLAMHACDSALIGAESMSCAEWARFHDVASAAVVATSGKSA